MGVELKTAILFPYADGSRGGVPRLERRWAKDRGISHAAKGHLLLGFLCSFSVFFDFFFRFAIFAHGKRWTSGENHFYLNLCKTDPNLHPTGRFATKEPTNGAKNPTQSNKGLESTKFFGFKQPDFQVSCLFAGKGTSWDKNKQTVTWCLHVTWDIVMTMHKRIVHIYIHTYIWSKEV